MKKRVLSILSLELSVDPQEKFQTIEFFGAADAWSGNFVGKYWAESTQ